ncbi:MAG: circularly permuted type 2 ATP-grasp protein [Fimbriiglobus sp.]
MSPSRLNPMPAGAPVLPPGLAEDAGPPRIPYEPPPVGYDEAVGPGGVPRPHWHPFAHAVADLGMDELTMRWKDAQHLIRENGVTYNVYGDPRGMSRPWQLDPIPLLISPTESENLAAGLIQRAKLLELVCRDFYGPQRLLKDGHLPPELVYANPGFLRPCHGSVLPGKQHLHLYAANLGRGPNGAWHVLGDRTQAPSGAGYALENRIVLTRTLPEAFRDCRVHRLALFFRTFRDTLRSIAPRNKDNPRIVLLTPGPYNETYFEHAYLARYLGYTLVEGGDLTVRDNRVYLKVLGGLQPVDVIFRRLDDDFCDPLELRPDSFLGVPGLVAAVRAGTVAVANALGTGAMEAAALVGYLPYLCRELLGEDLRLPSAPSWWCGDPVALSHVLAHLTTMVVKPAFPASRLDPVFPEKLTAAQRTALVDRIKARPWEYVGQETMPLSSAPVLVGDTFQPRKMVVRSYLAADGDKFAVMPGGLTRVSASPDTMVVSMQRGGGSKDTWVLSAGPVSNFSMLAQGTLPVELTRAGGDLPSRAADNLFWLGRYAERAEGTTRLLRGIVLRLAERAGTNDVPELPAMLRALTIHCDSAPGFVGDGADARLADPEPEVLANVFDPARSSLGAVLGGLRRVAGLVRDRISSDMWRVVQGFEDFPTAPGPDDEPLSQSELLDLLNRTVLSLAGFGGLAVESMTRGEGWRFLNMGRKMERAMYMVHLLRGTLVTPCSQEGPVLEAVLEVADSSMTYRRRYLGSLRAEAVLDLLVCDETNPRSLSAQLQALMDDVDQLPRPARVAGRGPEQRAVLVARNAVQLAEPQHLAAVEAGTRPGLKELLSYLTAALPGFSDLITQQYLSHLQTSRHLAAPGIATDARPTGRPEL